MHLPKAIAAMLAASVTVISMVMTACSYSPPPTAANHDFSKPVPESDLYGEEWFDDSAIIGHSLMEGFELYVELYSNETYFTATGISTVGALKSKSYDLPNGGKGTLESGLSQRDFSKVFIMMGINEISSTSDSFRAAMEKLIALVRDTQPDTPIYILAITPTTKTKSNASVYNRENIVAKNKILLEVAEAESCYYLDTYACFADEDGYLPADKSTDGVHFKASQYKFLADYIKSHTVQE